MAASKLKKGYIKLKDLISWVEKPDMVFKYKEPSVTKSEFNKEISLLKKRVSSLEDKIK